VEEVDAVIFENGRKEIFNADGTRRLGTKKGVTYKDWYFSIGIGAGSGFGLPGSKFELGFPGVKQISVHAGFGIWALEGGMPVYSFGSKIFLWKKLYANLQVATVAIENREVKWYNEYFKVWGTFRPGGLRNIY
jgi:hypothetical protein